jgi:hypothetical protein
MSTVANAKARASLVTRAKTLSLRTIISMQHTVRETCLGEPLGFEDYMKHTLETRAALIVTFSCLLSDTKMDINKKSSIFTIIYFVS